MTREDILVEVRGDVMNRVENDYGVTNLTKGGKKYIDELFNLYKKNPYHARVVYFNNNSYRFRENRLFLYEDGKSFSFIVKEFSVGISITNKIYSRYKLINGIKYSKNKFWYIESGGKIKPLTYKLLKIFTAYCRTYSYFDIIEYLESKFPFLMMIKENDELKNKSFNSILSKKLFGLHDLKRVLYNQPINVIRVIEEGLKDSGYGNPINVWKKIEPYLDRVQNLRLDMIRHEYFIDTIRMARILGKKVNCNWGIKRMIEQHDKWSYEIGSILIQYQDEFKLNIREIFNDFSDFSGYRILRTNKELYMEGIMQHHCVGTYLDKIENGSIGIYHIDGYTLEIRLNKNIWNANGVDTTTRLEMGQFKGKYNKEAPKELRVNVENKFNEFINLDIIKGKLKKINDGVDGSLSVGVRVNEDNLFVIDNNNYNQLW